MREALKEAKKAYEIGEVPVGAVVAIKNNIIARAHNLTQTLNDVTAHAEMQAITSASNYLNGKYLKDCSIYITLEPCVMCLGAIFHARISNLVFGAYDPKTGACESVINLKSNKNLNHHCAIHGGILEKESKTLLQDFFKNKRQKKP